MNTTQLKHLQTQLNGNTLIGLLTAILAIALPVITLTIAIPNADSQSTTHTNITNKTITVSQGDRIFINGETACTIGYVDKETHTAYTAAHCLGKETEFELDIRQKPQNVKVLNKYRHIPIGTAHMSQNVVDMAIINLNENVIVGENIYSGNTILNPNTLDANNRICGYGATTKTVECFSPYSITAREIIGSTMYRKPGDSGGPTWVVDDQGETQGLIAIHSGYTERQNGKRYDRSALFTTVEWFDPAHAVRAPKR